MSLIILSLFLFQTDEINPDLSNAATVLAYGINSPATCYVREADSIEVPVAVMRVDGDANEGYKTVTAAVRFDSARLDFVGARLFGAGTLNNAIVARRDASESTLRRVTVTWTADSETRDTGILFYLDFKVKPLPDDVGSAVVNLGFDNATIKDAAGTVVKVQKQVPTTLTIQQDRLVVIQAAIQKKGDVQ